jgi:phosphotriesterase-related protein
MQSHPFTRRRFLKAGCALAAAPWGTVFPKGRTQDTPQIMTVTGPIDPAGLGVTLPHEHVLVDFIGADKVSKDRYQADEAFRVALPHLRRIKELGCRSLVECTPAFLGRDPALLRRLSEASGLQIITNTGYYSAVEGKFLPTHAYTETADQLAGRWLREWRDGIDGTGIRPGFLKISVDKAPLKDYNRKVVAAAALTHRESGLVIAAHTGNGAAALEEIGVLRENGVAPQAFIWVHAQNETDPQVHREALRLGAWVSFDGLSAENGQEYVARLTALRQAGHLAKLLVSHDAGWYHVGEPGGGTYRPHDVLFTGLVPALRKAGFSARDIDQLLVVNPREAFRIRIRRIKG